ncbi:MAG: hypothetical protein Q9178_005667 [Gyalolechia marmorata]
MTEVKACTAKEGQCYCEGCSPGRTIRARQYKELLETPVCRLPPEMLMNILERIDLVDIPAFTIATIHILRMRGVVPNYPSAMLQLMLLREEKTHYQPNGLQNMPKELLLAIGQSLTPNEKIHMVLATYRMRPEEVKLITHEP